MMKRFLDCCFSDMEAMNKKELLESLEASEGRVLIAECSLCHDSLLPPISNAEISAAFGADILLLNMFDVNHPRIDGIQGADDSEVIRELKRLSGRLIGVNLEPVDPRAETMGQIEAICEGRQASVDTALKAKALGIDFILLTGNPGTGVSNQTIIETLKMMKEAVGDEVVLMAGKMHAAGSKSEAGENIITKDTIRAFVEAGADVILIPAPGTVPGITLNYVKDMIAYAHSLDALTLTSIGTSQEGSEEATIRDIALMCKMCGTDLHHVGDAGFAPVVPESIMAYSIAIRGKRHTYARMARSINR
ncbi:DUF7916 family protein [Dielma fastidiosa]|uniref:Haloacid dehalogenase-like hydrolase n=1 Tax=Dielma fastidiosa TaxID=1034346 RepID=A0AB35UQR0_9FIRM|nr:haloacid dehalogenase-like hydrolase [Dielma fastidiosa]MDY5167499.1 haloacid dehalogenase-like hydrolase [Dielma fastidiosa]